VPQQVTASKVGQLLKCVRPFSPGTPLDPDDAGEAAHYGTAWHECQEILVKSGGLLDLEDALAALQKVSLPSGEAKSLHAHALEGWHCLNKWLMGDNPWGETFRVVDTEAHHATAFQRIGPKYSATSRVCDFDLETHTYDLRPGEFGGTYDLLVMSERRRCVIDHKTGDWGAFHQPEEMPQMLALATQTGADAVAILHAPRGLPPQIYASEVSPTALQNFGRRLRAAMRRIGDGSMAPSEEACKFCRARSTCPAKDGELLKRAGAIVSAASGLAIPRTPEELGRFHQMIGEVEKLMFRAREEIKSRVVAGEIIERPDGKVLVLETRSYESLSKSSIVEALGKTEGEKLISSLRKKGVVSQGERVEMHARKG
jgi:hypothetical protein